MSLAIQGIMPCCLSFMKSILLAILMAVSTTTSLSAGLAQKPFTRDNPAKIIANARKTVTPEGIERPGKVAPGTQNHEHAAIIDGLEAHAGACRHHSAANSIQNL